MGERTAQLLTMLRSWCEGQHGRQSEVARILNVDPSAVAHWFKGRRDMTGEQALEVQQFLRTIYGTSEQPAPAAQSVAPTNAPPGPVLTDQLQSLHDSLENKATKTIWKRAVRGYHHIIVGGPARDKAFRRITELLKSDPVLAQIVGKNE
jgi:transcriptional regulator with XRE-family HTH domain